MCQEDKEWAKALEERIDVNNELWLDLKEALGYPREFPVDIDGMIAEVNKLKKES